MKSFYAVLLSLVIVAAGCATRQYASQTYGRAKIGYPETTLSLRLHQDPESDDLILTLTNRTSQPLTNFFPQIIFEGSIWVLQEGKVPLKTYPSNYFRLMMHAFWCNPETVIPPAGCLSYRIALDSLVCPLSERTPDVTQPVTAFAFMDGLDAISNVIPLRHQERIQWRFNWLSWQNGVSISANTNGQGFPPLSTPPR
jgi:hypothetical protein